MKVKKNKTNISFELGRCSITLHPSGDRSGMYWLTTYDADQCPGDPPDLLLSKTDLVKLGRELIKYAETL